MTDQAELKTLLTSIIRATMARVVSNAIKKSAFDPREHAITKPVYDALVPSEIFRSANFERRFVTAFGNTWEKLAVTLAELSLGYCARNYRIDGLIYSEQLVRIETILRDLEHAQKEKSPRLRPNWQTELEYILQGRGDKIPISVICDVYAEDKVNNRRYAFELKSPYPNSDITKVSKEKMLKLMCMQPRQVDGAYYALPYNPYGTRDAYKWRFPSRWFDMKHDESVLVGDEFWDKVGGQGTYRLLIECAQEVGREYKPLIYEKFLGKRQN